MDKPGPHVVELLRWIRERPRTYADVMEAWRSNCPRHSAWEDAQVDGLVQMESTGDDAAITLTEKGRELLQPKK